MGLRVASSADEYPVHMHAGTVLAGRFEVEAPAGSGGMGELYRARDRATGSWVALKVLAIAELQIVGSVRPDGAASARCFERRLRSVEDGQTKPVRCRRVGVVGGFGFHRSRMIPQGVEG